MGGDITLFTNLCEKTREDAFERMLQHAAELGAHGVIGVRYDATKIMQGVTEVLCYGTAGQFKTIARHSGAKHFSGESNAGPRGQGKERR